MRMGEARIKKKKNRKSAKNRARNGVVEEWSVLEWAASKKDGGNCEMKATRLDTESWAKAFLGG